MDFSEENIFRFLFLPLFFVLKEFFFYILFNEYARAASLPRKATHAVMFRNNIEVILNTPTAITFSLQLH